MPIVPMKKLIVITTKDLSDNIIKTLGILGVIDLRESTDIIGLKKATIGELEEIRWLRKTFENIVKSLGLSDEDFHDYIKKKNIKLLELMEIKKAVIEISSNLKDLLNKQRRLNEDLTRAENTKRLFTYLKTLKLSPRDIVQTDYLTSILGLLDDEDKILHLQNVAPTAFIKYAKIRKNQFIVFIGIERELLKHFKEVLQNLGFKELEIYSDLKELDEQILEKKIEELKQELEKINKNLRGLKEQYIELLASIYISIKYHEEILYIKSQMLKSRFVYVLKGWIPQDRIEDVKKYLNDLISSGQLYYEIVKPTKFEEPPTYLKNPKIIKIFESVVRQYGQPSPYDIDPTPIVAFLWTLMFGFMFPDLGQGIFLIALGLYISRKREFFGFPGKKAGKLLIYAGISAAVFGALFGEFFLLETVIRPVYPGLTEGWIINQYYLLWVLKVALFFGVFTLTLGISLSIYINIRRGKILKALLSSKGLGGLLILYGIFGIGLAMFGIRIIPKIGSIGPIDIPKVPITEIGVAFSQKAFSYPYLYMSIPTYFLILGIVFVTISAFIDRESEGIGELIETLIGLSSNMLSFIRIAIFSIAHVIYAYVSTELLNIGLEKGGVNLLIGLLIFIFLNIFSVTLEALIVMIQATRLTFYEFFTKFYEGGGKAYSPYRLSPMLIKLLRNQSVVCER